MKIKVIIFVFVCLAISSGCVTEYNLATKRQETLLYGTDKEISIGDKVALQFDKHYELSTDIDLNERAQRILKRIVKVCDRQELVYTIKIIDEDKTNAVALPGGHVYVFKGLIEQVENDDQLAGVIAHEVGHITAKHAMKRIQAAYGYQIFQVAAISSGNRELASGANAIYAVAIHEYSQEDELEADRLAVRYLKRAGYDPKGVVGMLRILEAENKKAPIRRIRHFRSHPYIPERIAAANKEITGELKFEDYLNLMGND